MPEHNSWQGVGAVRCVMERFVRQENIKRYRQMFSDAKIETERNRIKKLLAEEEEKQIAAGDLEPAGEVYSLARARSDLW